MPSTSEHYLTTGLLHGGHSLSTASREARGVGVLRWRPSDSERCSDPWGFKLRTADSISLLPVIEKPPRSSIRQGRAMLGISPKGEAFARRQGSALRFHPP